MSAADKVIAAARALVAEVDRRHDCEEPPRRYMTPYRQVTDLRLALHNHDTETARTRSPTP